MPRKFRRRPVEVEAVQFRNWESAVEISKWLSDVFYIPEGFTHHMRKSLEDLTSFLVVRLDGSWYRVDPGTWIVKGENDQVSMVRENSFFTLFEPVSEAKTYTINNGG